MAENSMYSETCLLRSPNGTLSSGLNSTGGLYSQVEQFDLEI